MVLTRNIDLNLYDHITVISTAAILSNKTTHCFSFFARLPSNDVQKPQAMSEPVREPIPQVLLHVFSILVMMEEMGQILIQYSDFENTSSLFREKHMQKQQRRSRAYQRPGRKGCLLVLIFLSILSACGTLPITIA
jgi:hypothetical protein